MCRKALQIASVVVALLVGPAAGLAADVGPGVALDRRIALLTRELGLDLGQQAHLRALLLEQRAQVTRLWNESALAPALRVSNTQRISEHTADQIRSLLTEAQRRKYTAPRSEDAAHLPRSNVDEWMGQEGNTHHDP